MKWVVRSKLLSVAGALFISLNLAGCGKSDTGGGVADSKPKVTEPSPAKRPDTLTEAERQVVLQRHAGEKNKTLFKYFHQIAGNQMEPGINEWEFVSGVVMQECRIMGKYEAYFGNFVERSTFSLGSPTPNSSLERRWMYVRDNGTSLFHRALPDAYAADVVAIAERDGCEISLYAKKVAGAVPTDKEFVPPPAGAQYFFNKDASLTGTLVLADGVTPDEAKVIYPAIRLRAPIAIYAQPGSEFNIVENDVALIQLAFSGQDYKAMVGKSVTVTGQIFHADNGNHYTRALVLVKSIAPETN